MWNVRAGTNRLRQENPQPKALRSQHFRPCAGSSLRRPRGVSEASGSGLCTLSQGSPCPMEVGCRAAVARIPSNGVSPWCGSEALQAIDQPVCEPKGGTLAWAPQMIADGGTGLGQGSED